MSVLAFTRELTARDTHDERFENRGGSRRAIDTVRQEKRKIGVKKIEIHDRNDA